MNTLTSLHAKLDKLDTDIRFVIVYCHGERYVFAYDERHIAAVITRVCRFAANEDLAFTWTDAATVIKKVIEQEQQP